VDKAIIWDLDGVIVDTAPFHFEAWREIFDGLGRDFGEQDFKRTFGLRNEDIFRAICGDILPPEEMKALSEKKEALYREKAKDKIKPLPGALKLINSLKERGFKFALFSSTPIENINLALSRLKIEGHFSVIISDKEVKRGKPDPEGFLLAAKDLGVEAKRCIVLEDAIGGIRGAKAAGMKCIAVESTHPMESLGEADLVVKSLELLTPEDVEKIIEGGG